MLVVVVVSEIANVLLKTMKNKFIGFLSLQENMIIQKYFFHLIK